MPNEIRVRPNFCSGTITNNPLAAGGTTLNSANLANLPAIGSTQHCVVILDPLGAGAGPEVVYVTAHTASATSATIVRGREGTTGVQHATGTAWVAGPVASDWPAIGASGGEPTASGLPYEGEQYVDTTNDRLSVYSGSAWVRTGHYSTTGRTGFAVRRAANQSISSSTTFANISWDTEDFDSDSYITTTSATVTIPSGLGGLYCITFTVDYGLPTNGSAAGMRIIAGGVTHSLGFASYTIGGVLAVTVPLAAADSITAGVFQNVGSSSNTTARLWGYRIGA